MSSPAVLSLGGSRWQTASSAMFVRYSAVLYSKNPQFRFHFTHTSSPPVPNSWCVLSADSHRYLAPRSGVEGLGVGRKEKTGKARGLSSCCKSPLDKSHYRPFHPLVPFFPAPWSCIIHASDPSSPFSVSVPAPDLSCKSASTLVAEHLSFCVCIPLLSGPRKLTDGEYRYQCIPSSIP